MIKNKKLLLTLTTIIILAVAAAGVYYVKHKHNTDNTPSSGGINYGPPTNAEKQESADAKKAIDERQAKIDSQPQTSSKKVVPLIVSYGQDGNVVKVSARVPGIFEESGTCTLTLSKDGVNVTQSKAATQNVSEMSCGFISIERSKLSSGTWSATVTYSSKDAGGTSSPTSIKVQ